MFVYVQSAFKPRPSSGLFVYMLLDTTYIDKAFIILLINFFINKHVFSMCYSKWLVYLLIKVEMLTFRV
jgi:hypothetical protein